MESTRGGTGWGLFSSCLCSKGPSSICHSMWPCTLNSPICGHHCHSLLCPILILPDPSPPTKVKEQREGPVSPVLLERRYLPSCFWISPQRGEMWVLSLKRGRSEHKSALGHLKKRQRAEMGLALKLKRWPSCSQCCWRDLSRYSPNPTHCDPFLRSDSQWHVCYFATSRTLLSLGSQSSLCCHHATVIRNQTVLNDLICSLAFWGVEWLQCIDSQFTLLFSYASACRG